LLIRYWLWIAIGITPILAAFPLFAPKMPLSILLTFLLSPAYMLHQIEEHWRDRFRTFVNQRVFGGVEALTPTAVFWINVPIVWGINAGALVSAAFGKLDLALISFYMMFVNGMLHIIGTSRFGYNPGLVTSLLIFFPLSCAGIATITEPLSGHLIAFGIAVFGHVMILGYALLRVRRLARAPM